MKSYKEFLSEGKKNYAIYHKSFTQAVEEVIAFIKKNGYEYSEDEWFDTVSTGPKKPSDGKTNKYTLKLYKNDKEQRKAVHFQVYGMGNKYELNLYIS